MPTATGTGLTHQPTREVRLTVEEFRLLRDFVQTTTGIYLDESRMFLVESRLSPLVLERNLKSFEDYYYFLKYDVNRLDEFKKVADVLSTHETYFYREHAQIEALCRDLVPSWLESPDNAGRPLRIWSAGCSTGEEPLSIAIALSEAGVPGKRRIEIVANDLSERVLVQARAGVFRKPSFRVMPESLITRYFHPVPSGDLELIPEVRSLVEFRGLNLVDILGLSEIREQDFIFCRNVIIYFDEVTKRKLMRRFYESLRPGGYLFLGHSESLFRIATEFRMVQFRDCLGYQKPA